MMKSKNYTSYTIETTQKPKDRLNKEIIEGGIVNNLQKLCDVTTIICWQKWCEMLPKNIFIFAKTAFVFSLPNSSNLKRWGKSPSDQCSLCQQKQIQLYVLNNCPVSPNSDRYLWRHNSLMNTLRHCLSQVNGFDIFFDLPGYENPSNMFHDAVRPDLVLKRNHQITVIELTYCFETNLVHSRNFNVEKYKNIKDAIKLQSTKLKHFLFKCHHSVLFQKHLNP